MIAFILALGLLLQRGPAPQAASITGQLQTRDGAPASAVRVSAIVAPPPNVRPEEGIQYYEAPPPISTTLSDAQGRYRLANLPAGRYYIVAAIAGQGTYYPGTADRDRATIVTVERGSTSTFDFRLVIPLGGRVAGRISPPPAPGAEEKAVLSGVKLEDVIETPIRPDGTFEFGHMPHDTYLLNVAPTPPGLGSIAFQLRDDDLTMLQFDRPPTHVVSGRIVVDRGPLPVAWLAFSTPQTYEPVTINPDLTFSVRLQSARHRVELAGMPGGYSIDSVRVDVANTDISGLVINVRAPRGLPHVRGRVISSTGASAAASRVRLEGPIVGALETSVGANGVFDFAAVTPGHYTLSVPQSSQFAPRSVVVDWNDANVELRPSAP